MKQIKINQAKVLLTIITIAMLLTLVLADIKTLQENWDTLSKEEKENQIKEIIQSKNPKVTSINGLASNKLTLKENGELTNGDGKARFDLNNPPKDLVSIEFSETKNGFVHKFEEGQTLTIRTGILRDGFKIEGTGWPSDGLSWNGKGDFTQIEEGVNIDKGAEIDVKSFKVAQSTTKKGNAKFKEGEEGNNYVKGSNVDIKVNDATITLGEKETEFIFGDKNPDTNQYVKLNNNVLEIVGDEILIEKTGELNNIEAKGNNIFIKNGENLIAIRGEKTFLNRKQTEMSDLVVKNLGEESLIVNNDLQSPFVKGGKNRLNIFNKESLEKPNIEYASHPLQSSVMVKIVFDDGGGDKTIQRGSATLVHIDKDGNGYFTSAAHNFDETLKRNPQSLTLETPNKETNIPFEIEYASKSNRREEDISIIKVSSEGMKGLSIRPSRIAPIDYQYSIGQENLRIGCLDGSFFQQKTCTVTRLPGIEDSEGIKTNTLETTNEEGRKGLSGGGLFNSNGELIAITSGGEKGVAGYVPIKEIHRVFKSNNINLNR